MISNKSRRCGQSHLLMTRLFCHKLWRSCWNPIWPNYCTQFTQGHLESTPEKLKPMHIQRLKATRVQSPLRSNIKRPEPNLHEIRTCPMTEASFAKALHVQHMYNILYANICNFYNTIYNMSHAYYLLMYNCITHMYVRPSPPRLRPPPLQRRKHRHSRLRGVEP